MSLPREIRYEDFLTDRKHVGSLRLTDSGGSSCWEPRLQGGAFRCFSKQKKLLVLQ
jgi:hypothetical protein